MKTIKTILTNKRLNAMFIAVCSIVVLTGNSYAQKGYSTASYAVGKMRADALQVPLPSEVIIEEYVNYHTHNLPMPKQGESVALDVRWGNSVISPQSGEAILQIGLTTNTLEDLSSIPPVNISLVIDKSGSMSGPRIAKAKQACREFVKRLREQDIISIVAFDNTVTVLLPAQSAGNTQAITAAIDQINAGGSTDLNSGLIRGYDEVVKNYGHKMNNKVIMLTDALTNTGVVDPMQIIQNSNGYSKEMNIDITMIGIGVNFNNELSRQLAGSAKCSIHFLNDGDDIKKVFIDEVESLLSPIARNVRLVIEYDGQLEMAALYGYSPQPVQNRIVIELDNMNAGLTQVVLAKFFLKNTAVMSAAPVKVSLSYFDIQKDERASISSLAALTVDRNLQHDVDVLKDREVEKNFTIAFMAQSLLDMAIFHQQGKLADEKQVVSTAVGEVKSRYSMNMDQDVKRVLDILEKYDTSNQNLANAGPINQLPQRPAGNYSTFRRP